MRKHVFHKIKLNKSNLLLETKALLSLKSPISLGIVGLFVKSL